jgi:plastocyanin
LRFRGPGRLGRHHQYSRIVIVQSAPRVLAALLAVAAIIAGASCAGGDSSRGGSGSASRGAVKTEDSAGGTIDLGGSGYSVRALSASGTLAGVIKLTGRSAADTMTVAKAREACGMRGRASSVTDTSSLANTVVWIADPKSGKPLPIEKRTELSSDDCMLDPVAQAVVVGTTVNVFNDDKALHRLIFTHVGQHDTLTVMPFFNTGQVVASERLAKEPGVVAVQCANHHWMQAYVVVLDHPYFDVTGDDGSFKIDSIAPGTYDVMIWRPGMAKAMTQRVAIVANGTAKLGMTIGR